MLEGMGEKPGTKNIFYKKNRTTSSTLQHSGALKAKLPGKKYMNVSRIIALFCSAT
jgi:hypothetical protein